MNNKISYLFYLSTAVFASVVGAQTVIFQDNFSVSDTDDASIISDPTYRGAGTHNNAIEYSLYNGSFVEISDEKMTFTNRREYEDDSTTPPTIFPGDDDVHLRFVASSGSGVEFDFASYIGDKYEISYKAKGSYNSPLTFSMSDDVTTGRYNADDLSAYDLGLKSWLDEWSLGEDGDNLYNGKDSSGDDIDASRDTIYNVRILIDETIDDEETGVTEAAASLFINDSLVGTYDIEFESGNRYLQFTAREEYLSSFDDLVIAKYTVPELSNTVLIFSFIAVSFCLIRRSHYRL